MSDKSRKVSEKSLAAATQAIQQAFPDFEVKWEYVQKSLVPHDQKVAFYLIHSKKSYTTDRVWLTSDQVSSLTVGKAGELVRQGKLLPVDRDQLSPESQGSWDLPSYYEDQTYWCVDCGEEQMFTAKEQKDYYETKKRYIYKGWTRCETCYEARLKQRRIRRELHESYKALKDQLDDTMAVFTHAQTMVKHREIIGFNDLQLAIRLLQNVEKKVPKEMQPEILELLQNARSEQVQKDKPWCVDCGENQIFTATGGRDYHETRKRYIHKKWKRCEFCYKAWLKQCRDMGELDEP